MKLLILNGPNLNLLGQREPNVYGNQSFDDYFSKLQFSFTEVELAYFQSNSEGDLIDALHDAKKSNYDGIIFNPAAYTHTSLALADAVAAIDVDVVEVHISNVMKREKIRHTSFISPNAVGIITGFGLESYRLAITSFLNSKL